MAVELLASGMTVTEVARQLGADPSTLHRWLNDPLFVAELEARRDELIDAMLDQHLLASRMATAKLMKLMDSDNEQVALRGVKDFIFRHQDVARAERKHMGEEARELSLPDEGELIEEIMWPYPTARLRARQRREATRLLVNRQARESRRQDATKCNTLQD